MEYVIEKARELLREIFGLDMELLPVRKKKEAPGKKIGGFTGSP